MGPRPLLLQKTALALKLHVLMMEEHCLGHFYFKAGSSGSIPRASVSLQLCFCSVASDCTGPK